MKLQVIIRKLRAMKVAVPPGTLRRWASEKLVSSPTGRTRNAEWPPEVVEEAAIANFLLRSENWRTMDVFLARYHALRALAAGPEFYANLDRLLEASPQWYANAFRWLVLLAKVRNRLALDKPRTFVVKLRGTELTFTPKPPAKVRVAGETEARFVDRLTYAAEMRRKN